MNDQDENKDFDHETEWGSTAGDDKEGASPIIAITLLVVVICLALIIMNF